jgi:hypothetical protein
MFYERRADRLYQLAVRTEHGVVTADIDARGVGTLHAVYDATDTTASYDLLPDWDASVPPAREAPETRVVWETWLRSPAELRDAYGLTFLIRVSTYEIYSTAVSASHTLREAGMAQATHLWGCLSPLPDFVHFDIRRNRNCTAVARDAVRRAQTCMPRMLLAARLMRLPPEVAELIWREYVVAPGRMCAVCDAFRDLV